MSADQFGQIHLLLKAKFDNNLRVFFNVYVLKPFSKKCDIWCHKGNTDNIEKQVGCYVNLDGVDTFSDT